MPEVMHCHDHLPIFPIWDCPWTKILSNAARIESRLCGKQISETIGYILPKESFMGFSRLVVVHCYSNLPNCPKRACPWPKLVK